MKKLVSLFTILILLTISNSTKIFAIRAYPYPISITQPDGSKLTILLHGDENYRYRTTEDGYLIKKAENGFFTYQQKDTKDNIVNSGIIARNANKRSVTDKKFLQNIPKITPVSRTITTATTKQRIPSAQKAKMTAGNFPLTGSPKSLVILVNFSDRSFVTSNPQTSFTNLLNEAGYSDNAGTGSAKDYFMSCSLGQFSPGFDVVGPYTLPDSMYIYGANDSYGEDIDPARMVVDACAAADADVDFSQYDTDEDGIIDNVFIYYAGYNEAEGANDSTVWPHRWVVYTSEEDAQMYTYDGTLASITFDGKRLYDYACTSELKGFSESNMCGIGTFCHEFGHVLGLPDYYDTSGLQANTLNNWDIMDYGAYLNSGRTPPLYSCYDRFFLGWLTPEQKSSPKDLTLLPAYQEVTIPADTKKQSYLFSTTTHNLIGNNPSPSEFFMVEYRKKTGWDTYLPAEGMLIWHIDYDQTAWDNNTPNNYTGSNNTQTAASHMRVYLHPLSGLTTPGTAFTTGSFTPTTWNGTDINRAITEITKTSDSITFKLMGGTPDPSITIDDSQLNIFNAFTGSSSELQNISISAVSLPENLSIILSPDSCFDIKTSDDSNWSKSLNIEPTDGSISASLQIRYTPTTGGNHKAIITLSSAEAETKTIELNGTAYIPDNNGTPTIKTGIIDNSLIFGKVYFGKSKTKTLNIKTTNIESALTVLLSGTNASMFEVSTNTIEMDSANGTYGTNITIQYTPTATGTHNATLTISGGGLSSDKIINITAVCE
ncbi:MAG: M6 family metalloprotease domain-containing protein [Paludibacter sp.]|nr:M6 family metalloprotease domain-containing protein [Paludibacter sp.]